jgi:hypothetical protein
VIAPILNGIAAVLIAGAPKGKAPLQEYRIRLLKDPCTQRMQAEKLDLRIQSRWRISCTAPVEVKSQQQANGFVAVLMRFIRRLDSNSNISIHRNKLSALTPPSLFGIIAIVVTPNLHALEF